VNKPRVQVAVCLRRLAHLGPAFTRCQRLEWRGRFHEMMSRLLEITSSPWEPVLA